MLEEERDRGGEQKYPTSWYLLNIFRILYTIVLKFSVTILLSIWVKKTQNVKIYFFTKTTHSRPWLMLVLIKSCCIFFWYLHLLFFCCLFFKLMLAVMYPEGFSYWYTRMSAQILCTLKRRYIFIYSNIFHRSYVSSFKTWVKFVFCFKVSLL